MTVLLYVFAAFGAAATVVCVAVVALFVVAHLRYERRQAAYARECEAAVVAAAEALTAQAVR